MERKPAIGHAKRNGGKLGRCAAICLATCSSLAAAVTIAEPIPDTAIPTRSTAVAQPDAVLAALRNDAALNNISFVDAMRGWAVGDRGVIWHTSDGGSTWTLQESGVACTLNSVLFINARHGWAVGGENLPYQNATRGVVLHTADGGAHWTKLTGVATPRLNKVMFFDAGAGIAVGESAAAQPSGVFLTRDGGRTWTALPVDRRAGWLTGDFLDVDTGSVAGAGGQFATLMRRQVVHSPLATGSLRAFRSMHLAAPTGGWLVGDGGFVATTSDLGHSWQSPPGDLPDGTADNFDFQALDVCEQNVWVAGSPGTRVFQSADGGNTWHTFATGQQAPIRALKFVDARHGWAAGEFGCILATRDGGRTWHVQRTGGRRAALLAIFASADDVPLEVLAQYGAAEGYIVAVDSLFRSSRDQEGSDIHGSHRARDAMLRSGAAAADTAWRFPLPPADLALAPDEIVQALNRSNDGEAAERLQRRIVRAIRMWRPDVVLTQSASDAEPLAAAVEELVLQSVDAAKDSTRLADLTTDAGLEPWAVKRVYGVLPNCLHGEETVIASQFAPLLGTSLDAWCSGARSLLHPNPVAPPESYELKLLTSAPSSSSTAPGLFAGNSLMHGSDARRPAVGLLSGDLVDARNNATRRRHLQALMQQTEPSGAWAGQIASLLDGLDTSNGGELLFELAAGYRAAGQLDMAADTYYLLARRYPDHVLVEPSLVWLVHFYASSEIAHRLQAHNAQNFRPVRPQGLADEPEFESSPAAVDSRNDSNPIQQANAVEPDIASAGPAIGLSRDDRFRRAAQLVDQLKLAQPALYAEPAIRFAEVAALRQLGYANEAKRYFLTLSQLPQSDPWRRCAETEEWLSSPDELPPPKILAACRRANKRPHLDGSLDEPFWRLADVMRLRGDQTAYLRPLRQHADGQASEDSNGSSLDASEVRLAYDEAFLYVAIRCEKADEVDYRTNNASRPRDADLSQQDRAVLQLDLDRDFSTAYKLAVDCRGWTHDACCDDPTWNPRWYVAAAAAGAAWTIEFAIPLSELSSVPPRSKDVWAVSARRTIPGIGYESWSTNAAADDSPERFGLLIFE